MAAVQTAPAIGIDLGTTYSAVAVMLHGKVEIIANDLGFFTTPSYVAFTDVERLVGDAAKKQAPMNSANTIYDAKRLIGRKFDDPEVQKDMKNWPFKVIDCNSVPKIEIDCKGEKNQFFVEEISAMVLTKMKDIAEAYLNQTISDAVITVPAYFNHSQRQATRDAAKIAGLNVLRIINEPTAAAIAYEFQNFDKEDKSRQKNVLVYDLGGGTFDVSVVQTKEFKAKVLASSGNTHLGGEDFDNRLIDHLVQEFKRRHQKDIRSNQSALRRLKTACEQEKRILSSALQTSVEIDRLCDGINFSSRISRARFEELNADLFKTTLKPVEQAISDAGLQKEQIDEVVLVGGSSRIPKIQKLIFDFFNGKIELSKTINPDEAVAHGAAILAAILHGDFSTNIFGFSLEEVTPLSLGLEVVGGKMSTVIKRNSVIPAKQVRIYSTTSNNQSTATIAVYQGESSLIADNHFLGQFKLTGIPPGPAGSRNIDVEFNMDLNGILTVTAVDKSNEINHRSITIENSSAQFSSEQIQQMIKENEDQRRKQKEVQKLLEARAALEEECCEISSALMDMDSGTYTKKALSIECESSIQWLMLDTNATKDEYEKRLTKLKDLADRCLKNKRQKK